PARGESLASHRDERGAQGSPTRQPRWGPRPAGKARRLRTGAPAARGLRGGVAIPGVFEGGATPPAPGSPTRQPRWGGAGMHRSSNAARLSPRAVKWPDAKKGGERRMVLRWHLRLARVPDGVASRRHELRCAARVKRSTRCVLSVAVPNVSGESLRKFVVSTTNVSPSHRPTGSPSHRWTFLGR